MRLCGLGLTSAINSGMGARSIRYCQHLNLIHQLRGHRGPIFELAWSNDGNRLASASGDGSVCVWSMVNGERDKILEHGAGSIYAVAWSPDGKKIACGAENNGLYIWDVDNGQQIWATHRHSASVAGVAWSPSGDLIASGSLDRTVRIWSATGDPIATLYGHADIVNSVIFSRDGQRLLSTSSDHACIVWNLEKRKAILHLVSTRRTIMTASWSPDESKIVTANDSPVIEIWNAIEGYREREVEGHTAAVVWVGFWPGGRLLGSRSAEGEFRIWRTDNWATVAILNESPGTIPASPFAFHNRAPLLATADQEGPEIVIWRLEADALHSGESKLRTTQYANAMVLLVGDTGVGKSGLALVLTGHPFEPTDSTHGRRIHTLCSDKVRSRNRIEETREVLLWDLAGQPGYRIVHQLHLDQAAVAVVVFDARNETDPFAGVRHWRRALIQAQLRKRSQTMRSILVAARIDRGGIAVSRPRIDSIRRELGFSDFIETSAKEGWGVRELRTAILNAIDWSTLSAIASNDLFDAIKNFLIAEKRTGRILETVDDLHSAFNVEGIRSQFETCVDLLHARGQIARLTFGGLILLQPEILDSYASAMIDSAKQEPEGMGFIREVKALNGDFRMPIDCRLHQRMGEKLLLIATVEELLSREIALRETADDGVYLVFPSEFTRDMPDMPEPHGKSAVYDFEGAVTNIYSTLAVRLCHSVLFRKLEMWRNGSMYGCASGKCGLYLEELGEGHGRLVLFFENGTTQDARLQFEQYVSMQISRYAIPGTISRIPVLSCPVCGASVSNAAITARIRQGQTWVYCNVCEPPTRIELPGEYPPKEYDPNVFKMDIAANELRHRDSSSARLHGKRLAEDFDVFMCYNTSDKQQVLELASKLVEDGILPWIDEWELRPGFPWTRLIESQIGKIRSAAVFIGKEGVGPWQREEIEAFLRQFSKRRCPVIPVLLAEADTVPQLPIFLEGHTWVDFRTSPSKALEALEWGITGQWPHSRT